MQLTGARKRVIDLVPQRGLRQHAKELYRGKIIKVSREGDYAFVGHHTVSPAKHHRAPRLTFTDDLMLHVRHNRTLGDPLPSGVWVNFYLTGSPHCRSGIEVCDAELDTLDSE